MLYSPLPGQSWHIGQNWESTWHHVPWYRHIVMIHFHISRKKVF